jgi:serine/threonine protein kinase
LQYGVLADIYSLAIIIFELFSGLDPFPGNIGQICQAKIQDEKPKIPSEFPEALKKVIRDGWSKKPRERPELEKFRLALSVMLREEENQSLTLTDETKMASFPVVFKGEYH